MQLTTGTAITLILMGVTIAIIAVLPYILDEIKRLKTRLIYIEEEVFRLRARSSAYPAHKD